VDFIQFNEMKWKAKSVLAYLTAFLASMTIEPMHCVYQALINSTIN